MKHDDFYESVQALLDLEKKLDNTRKDLFKVQLKAKELERQNPEKVRELISNGLIKPLPEKIEQEYEPPSPLIQYIYENMRERHVPFYFDDTIHIDENLYETGRDFYKNGILDAPFDRFFFYSPNMFPAPDDEQKYFLTIGHKIDSGFQLYLDTDKKDQIGTYDAIVYKDGSHIIRDISKEGYPTVNDDRFSVFIDAFFQCLIVMNHPYYEKEDVSPPEKVNKKREKSGKQKLTGYITIKVNQAIREKLSDGNGGTRRPHWRRGHIRRLNNGNITSVRPCMVNFSGEPIEYKEYKVS